MSTVSRILGEAMTPYQRRIYRDPHQSYWYANFILKRRFPAGEKAIATDPYYACLYARHVIKGRFPEGEAVIATDPRWSVEYLKSFPDAKLEWAMNGWLDWTDL